MSLFKKAKQAYMQHRIYANEAKYRSGRNFLEASRKKYGKSLFWQDQYRLAKREAKYRKKFGRY